MLPHSASIARHYARPPQGSGLASDSRFRRCWTSAARHSSPAAVITPAFAPPQAGPPFAPHGEPTSPFAQTRMGCSLPLRAQPTNHLRERSLALPTTSQHHTCTQSLRELPETTATARRNFVAVRVCNGLPAGAATGSQERPNGRRHPSQRSDGRTIERISADIPRKRSHKRDSTRRRGLNRKLA